MKQYVRELTVLLLQLAAFYVYPLFAEAAGPMGMVFIILLVTLLLSLYLGLTSSSRLKYLYPAAAALLFIPSVFLYYNESALVHALWYLAVSLLGLLPGSLAKKLLKI